MASITTTENQAIAQTNPAPQTAPHGQQRTKPIPLYHVILLDDDDHTYEYVIDMLRKLFGLTKEHAFEMACAVDTTGRVIIDTTTKERAEFKRDQIHAFGRDWRLPRCEGCMTCVVEPAE